MKKYILHKLLLLIAFFTCVGTMRAVITTIEVEIDGIRYILNYKLNTATVTSYGSTSTYCGDIIIPSEVLYNNGAWGIIK